jgi:hypothetical protein
MDREEPPDAQPTVFWCRIADLFAFAFAFPSLVLEQFAPAA